MGCPEKLRGIYGEDVVKITGFLFLHRKKYGKMSVSHIIESLLIKSQVFFEDNFKNLI